jgi:TrmH family RNA methyltransferase
LLRRFFINDMVFDMDKINNIRIVLVRPKYSLNIGSVCRAMKTMGLTNLIINGPKPKDFHLAYKTALHAGDILERVKIVNNLEDGLRDVSLTAAVTRRQGKWRKPFSITPEELIEKMLLFKKSQMAILFGNEETGLTDNELKFCHLAVKIPSSSLFPSLNLSHSVQIITYHIFRAFQNNHRKFYTPIEKDHLDHLVSIIIKSLKNLGFFKLKDSSELKEFFRDILTRAGLSAKESKRMEVIFRKISGLGAGKGI